MPDDSLEIARQYTRWFYTAQADSLAAHSAPSNRTFNEPLLVRFVLDEKGQITRFGLGPKSAAPAVDP